MRLGLMTWREVEDYLETRQAVIVPIGSTEQHGPTGLLGTDYLTADAVALQVGEREKTIVAPAINVGMAQHHLAFAGSMSLRPSTLMAVVLDYVRSLARNGFHLFYFVNGHGGNLPVVQTAFQELYADSSFEAGDGCGLRCRIVNWFKMEPVVALQRELYGDRDGFHATPCEISLTQHLVPDSTRTMPEAPGTAAPRLFTDAADVRNLYPEGHMASDPWRARPEHGRRFLDAAVESVAEDLRVFLDGRA